MSSQYAGDPDFFPTDYTIPDDSDPATASAFNVAAEALGDRTSWLKTRHVYPALNFPVLASASLANPLSAAYDVANRKWYVVGGDKGARASGDFGITWGSNELAAVGPGAEACASVAVDNDGNVVVGTLTRYVFEKTALTATWTRVDAVGADLSSAIACPVTYDSTHACWVHLTPSDAWFIRRSTNRITWTSPGTHPSWGSNAGNLGDIRFNKTTGRLVSVGFNGATSGFCAATSDDGGLTWTNRGSGSFGPVGTVGFVATHIALTYVDGTTWLVVANRGSSTSSEVWQSTNDGNTWTKIATLAFAAVFRPAPLYGMLVAAARVPTPSGNVDMTVYSQDGGATWRRSGHRLSGTANGAFSDPAVGGVLVLSTGGTLHSARIGLPEEATLI